MQPTLTRDPTATEQQGRRPWSAAGEVHFLTAPDSPGSASALDGPASAATPSLAPGGWTTNSRQPLLVAAALIPRGALTPRLEGSCWRRLDSGESGGGGLALGYQGALLGLKTTTTGARAVATRNVDLLGAAIGKHESP